MTCLPGSKAAALESTSTTTETPGDLYSMIDNRRIDYAGEVEHQSVGVNFKIFYNTEDWFNTILLSRVDITAFW